MAPARTSLLLFLLVTFAAVSHQEQEAEEQAAVECSEDVVSSVNTNLVNGLFTVLETDAGERHDQCTNLRQFIVDGKDLLSQCAKEDDDMEDSASWKSFQRYTMVSHLKEMATIHRLLCSTPFGDYQDDFDWQHESEASSACNLTNARGIMRNFMMQKIQWEDTPSCSLVTSGVTALQNEVNGCSWEARSVMSLLIGQVKKLMFVACTPKTCNVAYARMCLAHADQALPEGYNATDVDNRQFACKNLKYALACAANHTRTCKPSIYSSVSDIFASVQERFNMNDCAEFFPRKSKPSCSAQRQRGMDKNGDRQSQRGQHQDRREEQQTRDARDRDAPTRLIVGDEGENSTHTLGETNLLVGEQGNGNHQTKDVRLRGEPQRGEKDQETTREMNNGQESKAMSMAKGVAQSTFFAREVYRQECRTSVMSSVSSNSSYADFGNGTVISSQRNSSSVNVSSQCSTQISTQSLSSLCLKGNCNDSYCGIEYIEQCDDDQVCPNYMSLPNLTLT
jgi:hypothetical protein